MCHPLLEIRNPAPEISGWASCPNETESIDEIGGSSPRNAQLSGEFLDQHGCAGKHCAGAGTEAHDMGVRKYRKRLTSDFQRGLLLSGITKLDRATEPRTRSHA